MIPQKLPQHWAAEAAVFESHEERAAFVKRNVPEHLQDAVIYHLKVRRQWKSHSVKQERIKKAAADRERNAKSKSRADAQRRRESRSTWTAKY